MLELGKNGSHGTERGTLPVLSGDAVVATLRASSWKEAATADVQGRSWEFRRAGSRELTGRWSVDPEDAVRLRARQLSMWKGTWAVELDGLPVEVVSTSWWKHSHRYSAQGRLLADSGSTGGWSPRPTLTPAEGLLLDHAVFLLWFELVLSRRAAAAAA
ncbi:hypothetical protein [Modestobacter versicolor]|uniref:Uncharacterized protein n=1 Tax=Modestobacter versicolor TaxID=429133 RepID=A0A323VDS6_9ACTN|nr:hypothetical protein [Modestobacter versicolor]MBB3675855.1 hypothetical protein [Modestobacter versicolor]PZA22829.1 hypothetical protein DMO24_02890 [Modestobacter versicolor]